ncbi:MAG TPA: hypothetical protein PLJ37_01025 [Chitinophagales bacterium]|nr:hypothetical protein [Chitinophagales bacterium]HMW93410.1 hypothetical protein [Chitinophagales bacterium]HMZ92967.1 hypothetical protein [Chitinophagales bacterium]HNG25969.1 hypothetical protein [Chitinophagales bacterium]
MNINNESVGLISMQFRDKLDVLDFLNSLNKVKVVSSKHNELKKSLTFPNKKSSQTKKFETVYEEPLKKSLNHLSTDNQTTEEILEEVSLNSNKENEDNKSIEIPSTLGISTTDKLKKIPSDNRRKRNYRIDREQLLKYCIEAIQHNNELTVAELSNLISRNLGIETNQEKTEFYRYLYQFISNRSKKNIDIVKDNNYLYLKKNEEIAA